MGKNWQKQIRPSARNREKKWPKNGEKIGFGVIFLCLHHFWAIFSPFRAGPFSIFLPFFPIFGFRPVLHSIPGRPDSQGWRGYSIFYVLFFTLDGPNRQSPIASVHPTWSTLAGHSASPRRTNTTPTNANRATRTASQCNERRVYEDQILCFLGGGMTANEH